MTMLRDEQRFGQFVITVKGHAPERQTVAMGSTTQPREPARLALTYPKCLLRVDLSIVFDGRTNKRIKKVAPVAASNVLERDSWLRAAHQQLRQRASSLFVLNLW